MINRRHFLRNAALFGAGATLATMPAFRAFAEDSMRLYWWGTPSRAERTLGVAKLFEAAHSGAKIVGEVGGSDYWAKLTTMIAGGNAPDIFQLEPSRFADYSRRSTNLPLNDYLGKVIRTDKLVPGVLGHESRAYPAFGQNHLGRLRQVLDRPYQGNRQEERLGGWKRVALHVRLRGVFASARQEALHGSRKARL